MANTGSMLSQFQHDFVANTFSLDTLYNLAEENCFLELSSEGSSKVKNVSLINTKLNTSKTRLEGLCLLHQVVQTCNAEMFQENGIQWLKSVLQILQSHNDTMTHQMSCDIMTKLIGHSARYPEMNRETSTNLIPQIITALLNAKDSTGGLKATAGCLCACIGSYPGPCGPYKAKLEAFSVSLLANNIAFGPVCYAYLAKLTGRAGHGNKRETWSDLCDKVIARLHCVLDRLYKDIEAYSVTNTARKGEETLNLTDIDESRKDYIGFYVHHFMIMAECVVCLLTEAPPSAIEVPVVDVMDTVCRLLAVRSKVLLNSPSMYKLQLASHLPLLHQSGFKILSALISSCKTNLVLHTTTVNRLFVQALQWTKTEAAIPGQVRPYGGLRRKVYRTINDWVTFLKSSCNIHSVSSDIVQNIIQDCRPGRESVILQARGVKKGKGTPSKVSGLSLHQKIDEHANHDVIQDALVALSSILYVCGNQIQPEIHRTIQELCITVLLDIQNSPRPIPYCNPKCRKELYNVLLACMLVPHPRWPPPAHCAIRLFSMGQYDADAEIVRFCISAMAVCENIVHPSVPSLKASVVVADMSHVVHTGSKEGTINNGTSNLKLAEEMAFIQSTKNRQDEINVTYTTTNVLVDPVSHDDDDDEETDDMETEDSVVTDQNPASDIEGKSIISAINTKETLTKYENTAKVAVNTQNITKNMDDKVTVTIDQGNTNIGDQSPIMEVDLPKGEDSSNKKSSDSPKGSHSGGIGTEMDEVGIMMQSFVDAQPDSD